MLVKATQHVKDRLERQILKLADTECKTQFGKTATDALCNVTLGADVIDEVYWGKYLSFRSQLPKEWFPKLSQGSDILFSSSTSEVTQHNFYINHRIGSTYGYGEDAYKVLDKSVTAKCPAFIVPAPKDILLPPSESTYNAHVKIKDWSAHPELKKARDKAVAILTIVDKWRAVHAKIIGLFDSTKSVNEAVKLWPELVTFLDPEDRQRLQKEGTTKKARESRIDEAKKLLAEIDTQSIVADVVGIKLSAA